MMELEDLVLKHYRVERRERLIVAIEDEEGKYKAPSASALEDALNGVRRIRKAELLFVRFGKTWHPISNLR